MEFTNKYTNLDFIDEEYTEDYYDEDDMDIEDLAWLFLENKKHLVR